MEKCLGQRWHLVEEDVVEACSGDVEEDGVEACSGVDEEGGVEACSGGTRGLAFGMFDRALIISSSLLVIDDWRSANDILGRKKKLKNG